MYTVTNGNGQTRRVNATSEGAAVIKALAAGLPNVGTLTPRLITEDS